MADFTPQQIEQFLQEFFDVVGTRQYVGARYVPVFGHGGETPIEWDGGNEAYEPLSIVYHVGKTYTSRRYVPAGIDITNTDYWVVTANYNAQVEQYRQEVLGFQDQIDDIRADLESDYVPFPDSSQYPKYGTNGQVLATHADGTTEWQDPVVPSDAQAEAVITDWLDQHPEATTTVQDGAITTAKLADASVTNAKIADSTIENSKLDPNGILMEFAGHDNYINWLSELDELPLVKGDFAIGAYDTSGTIITTNHARAYKFISNVKQGATILFDATKFNVTYFYVNSVTHESIYALNSWDTSGALTLSYKNNGTVCISVKDPNGTNLSSRLEEIDSSIAVYNGCMGTFNLGEYSSATYYMLPSNIIAYKFYDNVINGATLYFDATKFLCKYFYVDTSSRALIYTPSNWDSSGEIVLDYADNASIYVCVRAKGGTDISSRLEEINNTTFLDNFRHDSFALGAYVPATGEVSASTTRAYRIFNNVVQGATLYFDPSAYQLNYFYIDPTTHISIYTPNAWNSDGAIQLDYADNATVLVSVRKPNNDDISSKLNEISNTTFIINTDKLNRIEKSENWVAYGDSITAGTYSNGNTSAFDPTKSYAYKIANDLEANKIANFYNCGVRGVGWLDPGNNNESLDDMLGMFSGTKTSITLVTVMLGINDYNANAYDLGTTSSTEKDGTLSGNIRYGIRWICENYPNASVCVISTLNTLSHGNVASAWARNTALHSGTLEDLNEMIEYWADYFGVKFINLISSYGFNTYSAQSYLQDGLHPTIGGHEIIAKQIRSELGI